MSKRHIDARLELWDIMWDGSIIGSIYSDKKGRFPDGRRILTSPVTSHRIWKMRRGSVVTTATGSVYKLGMRFSIMGEQTP